MAQLGRDHSALKEEEKKNIWSEFSPSQPPEEENNDYSVNIIWLKFCSLEEHPRWAWDNQREQQKCLLSFQLR